MRVINKRRRFLVIATSTLGATGLGFATVPFIASMRELSSQVVVQLEFTLGKSAH